MTKPATENPLVNVRLVYSKDTWLNQQPTSHWPGQCSPIMAETTSAIKVRNESDLVTVRNPEGNWTTYNGYVMVTNSTIDLSDKIRINSTDYSPKHIEPQYWLDGTETHRIVYF